MRNRRNYYRILHVQPDAPLEVIHSSYRAILKELKGHPDLGGSTEEALLLNEAYETLKDPERRAAYDEELFRRFTNGRQSAGTPVTPPVFCPSCKRPLNRNPGQGEGCERCRPQATSPAPPVKGYSRAVERTSVSERIRYYRSWPGDALVGKMVDFSPMGMRFLCRQNLKPQTMVRIRSRLLEASGVVTNAHEKKSRRKPLYTVGVSFLVVKFTESPGVLFSTSA